MPSNARRVVVFPDPLLPKNPKVSPRFTSNDRSLITVRAPKSIRKWLTSMMGRTVTTPTLTADFA